VVVNRIDINSLTNTGVNFVRRSFLEPRLILYFRRNSLNDLSNPLGSFRSVAVLRSLKRIVVAERTSLGLKFCLLARRTEGTFAVGIRWSWDVVVVVVRMERRVDVAGMVIGITRGFSEVRRRWNDVGSLEGIIVSGVDEAGTGEVN
jgi:hypothetical protein